MVYNPISRSKESRDWKEPDLSETVIAERRRRTYRASIDKSLNDIVNDMLRRRRKDICNM